MAGLVAGLSDEGVQSIRSSSAFGRWPVPTLVGAYRPYCIKLCRQINKNCEKTLVHF